MSSELRHPWGWTAPARRLLIAIIAVSTIGLGWLARGRRDASMDLRSLLVDPNTAPPAVLGALPGIGPVKAAAIVEAREARAFRSLADLDKRVKGIGPVTAAALKPYFRFSDVTASP